MPLPDHVIPRDRLTRIMKRFIADEHRGISIDLFCELAGINKSTLIDVFRDDRFPLSEYIQRRVSKAYMSWLAGDVAVMQNRDNTRFVTYRKEPKPRFSRCNRLKVVDGKIQLDIGIKNKSDYSTPTLDEQLERKFYGSPT